MELLKYKNLKKQKTPIVFILEDYILLKNTFFNSDKFLNLDKFNQRRLISNLDNKTNLKTYICESMVINTILINLEKEDLELIKESLIECYIISKDLSLGQIIENIDHNLLKWGEKYYTFKE